LLEMPRLSELIGGPSADEPAAAGHQLSALDGVPGGEQRRVSLPTAMRLLKEGKIERPPETALSPLEDDRSVVVTVKPPPHWTEYPEFKEQAEQSKTDAAEMAARGWR
jgi:hypothetical protein